MYTINGIGFASIIEAARFESTIDGSNGQPVVRSGFTPEELAELEGWVEILSEDGEEEDASAQARAEGRPVALFGRVHQGAGDAGWGRTRQWVDVFYPDGSCRNVTTFWGSGYGNFGSVYPSRTVLSFAPSPAGW